jgi:hypothetical protein
MAMVRGIAFLSAAALISIGCGTDSGQEPQSRVLVSPGTEPPADPMAPLMDPQQPAFDDEASAPPPDPSAPVPNQQQPTPAPPSASNLPRAVVAACQAICTSSVGAECRVDCGRYCEAFSLIGSSCSREARVFIECIAAQGITCREQSGTINAPIGRCREELVSSVQVSEACIGQLFPRPND